MKSLIDKLKHTLSVSYKTPWRWPVSQAETYRRINYNKKMFWSMFVLNFCIQNVVARKMFNINTVLNLSFLAVTQTNIYQWDKNKLININWNTCDCFSCIIRTLSSRLLLLLEMFSFITQNAVIEFHLKLSSFLKKKNYFIPYEGVCYFFF